jgi:polysaccharide export outer membrane protein
VFHWTDLQNYRARVSAAGIIEVPMIGAMQVAGLTESQLRDRIAEALRRNIMRDPQVNVFVAEYVSHQVSVTGAVARPGLYGLTRDHRTVSDLLSEAGGLDKGAGGKVLLYPAPATGTACAPSAPTVQRASNVTPVSIDLNENYGDANPLELPVVAGDALVVNRGRFAVQGWVVNPGVYDIGPGMTAMGGVSTAGGPEFAGDLSKVVVWRPQPDGTKKRIDLDIDEVESGRSKDVTLEAGDVISVPVSYVRIVPYGAYMAITKIVAFGAYVPVF